jgi:hypothetical protein
MIGVNYLLTDLESHSRTLNATKAPSETHLKLKLIGCQQQSLAWGKRTQLIHS